MKDLYIVHKELPGLLKVLLHFLIFLINMSVEVKI